MIVTQWTRDIVVIMAAIVCTVWVANSLVFSDPIDHSITVMPDVVTLQAPDPNMQMYNPETGCALSWVEAWALPSGDIVFLWRPQVLIDFGDMEAALKLKDCLYGE